MASRSHDTAPPGTGRTSGPATVLHAGRRFPVLLGSLTIGRLPDNDIAIADGQISRNHARIEAAQGAYRIVDLGSRNGTAVNGERFRDESRWLASGDTIILGGESLRFVIGEETRIGAIPTRPTEPQQAVIGTQHVSLVGDHLRLGRDKSNDVVLEDPNVSRFHAEIERVGDRVTVRDLSSRNGTRLNGEPIGTGTAQLEPGSAVGIGPYQLIFDGSAFVARSEQGGLRLDAERVAMRVGDKQILTETTLSLAPGELAAFVGESGAGKTTLLKALAGVTTPTAGSVTVNGEPVAVRLTDVGYLPQDEIVHPELTVTEALTYSARLRLPTDTSDEEIAATVARVQDELGLQEHARTRVGALSGGQRKRVGVATELLSRPGLLFLDEPTTGLDPGLESKMMTLLRELADDSRAVTIVTHATKSLDLCDKLVVMGRGGVLCFQGTPENALEFFGAESYDDIYVSLASREPQEWQHRFAAEGRGVPVEAERNGAIAVSKRRRVRGRVLQQARVLTARYARVFVRDRRNVLILLLQIPILAFATVVLFRPGVFARPSRAVDQAVILTFLMLVPIVWIGSIDAAREIVKERGVLVRESAAGVRLSAYLLSKVVVLFVLAAIQAVIMTGIILVFQPLHERPGVYLTVLGIAVLTACAAVSLGLLVSAVARNQDQATSFIPLVMIPQLFFGGSIVTIAQLRAPLRVISKVVLTQWSYAGLGSSIDMNRRIALDPNYSRVSHFGHDFFTLSRSSTYIILVAYMIVVLLGVAWTLHRRTRA